MLRAEITRLESLLTSTPDTAPDKAIVTYQIARTWASAKQWPETMTWLQKVAGLRAGLDPSRDSIFAELRDTQEFAEILSVVREATSVVSRSTPAFRVGEGDLVPESIAYDTKRKRFYLGSLKKGKVVRCSASGDCAPFAAGLGVVLGLKVHRNGLWLLSNSDQTSALIHYDLASARVIHEYKVNGPGHSFNDLTIAPGGDIYLTDTPAGAVWYLAKGAADLARLPGRFEFANGIALSPDSNLLFVSTFPEGISVVDLKAVDLKAVDLKAVDLKAVDLKMDLKTQSALPIARPSSLCLANIDGLYFHRGALIAIQNGIMSPRVVRLTLARDLRGIERFEVLERRNPLFEGVTTGVVDGNEFFYMANIQDDKTSGFNPITILKLRL